MIEVEEEEEEDSKLDNQSDPGDDPDDGDDLLDNIKIMSNNNNERTPLKEYIFYVSKLGKRGMSKKSRILHVDQKGIHYYTMVVKRKDTESFLEHLKESKFYYSSWQVSNIQNLIKEFNCLPPKDKNLKGSFTQFSIKPQEKVSSFQFPIRIVNEDVDSTQQNKVENYWILETYLEEVQNRTLVVKEEIIKAVREDELKEEERLREEELLNKQLLEEEEERRRLEEMNQKEEENNEREEIRLMNVFEKKEKYENEKNLQTFDYEILYQFRIKEYYELTKLNKEKRDTDSHVEKIALELNIYNLYSQFVNKCSKTVRKIVKDFNTLKPTKEDFENKLHPIVYPNSFFFSDENNAVFLYHIWGVNYTMTWNKLILKINESHEPNKNSKLGQNQEDQFTKGKWKGLRRLFKQKDYFQDFLMKVVSCVEKVDDLPNVPMCCIIDYYGFRFYCENDISSSESSSISNYNKTQYSQFTSSQQKHAEFSLVKEIGRVLNSNNNKLETNEVIYYINPKELFKNGFDRKLVTKGYEGFNEAFKNYFSKPPNEDRALLKYMNIMKMLNTLPMGKSYINLSSILPVETEIKILKYLMNFDILVPNPISDKCHTRQEIIFSCFNDNVDEKKEIEVDKDKSDKIQSTVIRTENNLNVNIEEEKDTSKSREVFQKIIQNLYNPNLLNSGEDMERNQVLEKEFNEKFNSLLMAFDTLYFKPYNSETLKLCIHYFGINMHFLGKIAEESKVPHIREMCVIEMFARTCKKIIFDLIGQKIFENTMKDLYAKQQRLTKTLTQIPVSFNIHYGSDYLKSINIPVEDYQFLRQNDVEIKGLYIPYNETNPLKEENTRSERDELQNDNLILNFFSTLFDQSDITFKINLYGKDFNKSALWEMIIEEIKLNYTIKSDEIFMYCNLECMSNYALLSSLQYHTGITIPSSLLSGELSSLTEKECICKKFEKIEKISPKVSGYSFNMFNCKKGKILPLSNNFSLIYPGEERKHSDLNQQHILNIRIYPQAKLCYYADKFLTGKIEMENENSLSFYFFFYLKILKRWDKEKEKKNSRDPFSQQEKPKKEFDINAFKIPENNALFNPIFENNFPLFTYLVFSQYQPKNFVKMSKGDIEKENKTKSEIDYYKKLEKDYNLLKKAESNIGIYWNSKHPFISILNITFAKALYKNTENRTAEDKIESCFSTAVDIAKDSMGELNIYYGRITRDVGFFFDKSLKFYDSYRMYYSSYKVFKKHKGILLKDYHYSLKYLAKSCIYLGRTKECFQYGKMLIDEFSAQMSANEEIKNEEDLKENYLQKREELLQYWKQLHIETFAYNLMILAVILREYEAGIQIGNIFLYQLINEDERETYKIKDFKKWVKNSEERIEKLKTKKNDQNAKDYSRINSRILICERGINIGIEYIFEEYLKNVFCNLKGILNKTFAKAFVQMENEYRGMDYKTIGGKKTDFDIIVGMFYKLSGSKMNEYFNNNILSWIRTKYDREMYSITQIVQDNYDQAINEIKAIYRFFFDRKDLFVTTNSFKNE